MKKLILMSLVIFFAICSRSWALPECERSPKFGYSKVGVFPKWDSCVGTYNYPRRQYTGEWKDDRKHGQGTIIYGKGDRKGEKYVGEWMDDKMHGKGTLTWPNCHKYVGEFKLGKWEDEMKLGRGEYYYADGTRFEGEWKSFEITNALEIENRTIYNEEFNRTMSDEEIQREKAEQEAKLKRVRLKAEREAKLKREAELKAEREAKLKRAKLKVQHEAKLKREAKLKVVREAKLKLEREAKLKEAEREAKLKEAERLLAKKERIAIVEKKREADQKKRETKLNALKASKAEEVKNNPGFRNIKPGMHRSEIVDVADCDLFFKWKPCYDIDNIRFQGSFDKDNFLEVLVVDLGPIIETYGLYKALEDIISGSSSNIFENTLRALSKKYTREYSYNERERQLFNNGILDELLVVYNKGQVTIKIFRKKVNEYSKELWLYVEYRNVELGKTFMEANRPTRETSDDF
jgi:chemotaxis protein histidine kinase CheA